MDLDAPPSVRPLLVKAFLGGFTRRTGEKLPETEYTLRDAAVDVDHLAAYDRVCGFRLGDALPATYPHVMVFPLAMRLMTDPGFPFPVVGLVHVGNRITQTRPLRVGEKLTLSVRADDLRPHERGTMFDVVGQARVGGELVWSDVSTYLRRQTGPAGSRKEREPSEPPPASAYWRVGPDVGRRYADVSGDHNPIHTNRLAARILGFPRTIAHGLWTAARALAAMEGRLPDAFTYDVQFKLPMLLPAKVAFSSVQMSTAWRVGVHDARDGRPYLTGTASLTGTVG